MTVVSSFVILTTQKLNMADNNLDQAAKTVQTFTFLLHV